MQITEALPSERLQLKKYAAGRSDIGCTSDIGDD
jgi:hypothetical protein